MAQLELYPGIVFSIPTAPPKAEIINGWKTKKDQRWERYEIPMIALPTGTSIRLDEIDPQIVEELYESEHEDVRKFIDEDNARCTHGVWFMNNGTPTYITGYHYEYLQWYSLDVGAPFYSDKDRRWYYFVDYCFKDPECMGMLYGKKRRDGFSHRCMSITLASARKSFDAEYGMMSKTGDDAKRLFAKLILAFKKYPSFYKPQVASAEDIQKELFFKEPAKRVSQKNRRTVHGVSLETKINWRNTRENSYDGSKVKILTGDEVAKLERDVSFRKWFAVASTSLTQGRKIFGKALMGSSVEEAEKGGKEFKEVWANSNPLERDLNGRTLSGLYRYFTPAEDGLEGFIDEYGMSVMETPAKPVMGIDGQLIKIGAIEYLENVLKSKKEAGDMIGYYESKRQFPRTEADMFLDPKNETASLPVEKIYQQIEINNGFPTLPIRQGNFQWKDGLQDTYVVFHDDPKGRWLVYWMPKPEDRSKWVLLRGLKSPSFKDFGCFGLDPYDHKLTSEGKGSNAASHGYRKFDHLDPLFSDIFVTEYLARPMDPYEMYEDILMQCVFYGWPVLGESNKPGCMTYFENRGYFNYLMMRPAATHTDWSEENQESPWIPTTGDAVRNSLVSYLRAYIYQKIGLNEQTKKPGNMVFNRTLQDWLVFKGEGQWTDWDLTVSTMLAIAGSLDYKPKKKEVKNMQFFPVFGKDGRQINPHSDRPVSDNPLVVPFGR